MSGDSGQAAKHIYGQSIRPEPVSQKSLTENVADIINEVVFPNPLHYEGKEKIIWVKFDHCDVNDLSRYKEKIECNGNVPPFLLIIGYTNGVQVWVVQATGLATEVLSLRQGPVHTLKILCSPEISDNDIDKYSLKRPIMALCDALIPGAQFHSVAFLSLLTGETHPLKTIKFKTQIQDIYSNRRVVVISFAERLAVFKASNLEDLFTISTCYKSGGHALNPIALGDQWLAFADRKLYNTHQSCGGVITETALSYKSSVLSAAKSITKGLKDFGESVATNIMGGPKTCHTPPPIQVSPSQTTTPGVVTIVDTQRVDTDEVNLAKGPNPATVAHFVAHPGTPIVCMEFDSSGSLLATADKLAHNFHVFKINCHPTSSSQGSVHHLYSLYRGDTTANVLAMTFSLDSRWLAVSTHRGTTHIYPIAPYGGPVTMRTHKSLYVVNKLSKYHRSAGLDGGPSSGRNSPVLSASLGVQKSFDSSPNIAYHNPFYPPYPTATVVSAVGRIRQTDLSTILETYGPGHSPSNSPPSHKSSKVSISENVMKVALTFGATRGWIAGSPTVIRDSERQPVDSLFVLGYHGYLVEYILKVKPLPITLHEKIRDDERSLKLDIEAYAQWPMLREMTNAEIRPPLHNDNPLLASLSDLVAPTPLPPDEFIQATRPEEKWMSQVEIQTYMGPNRRLWMGPQFTFKTISGGNLSSVEIMVPPVIDDDDDPSLEFPQSSPINIGATRNNFVIEAVSYSNSVESDFEEVDPTRALSRLKDAIADAMMDVPSDLGADGDDCSLDMSDVMDITCDPVGPSTDYPKEILQPTSRPAEDQLKAVTAKLRQVAVTSHIQDGISSHWGSRTPSLEECKIMTSSGEDSEPPLVPARNPPEDLLGAWGSSVVTDDDGAPPVKNVWGSFVIESKPSLAPPESFPLPPPMSRSVSKSATTSEDDLWPAKENKKDRKKRRKRKEQDGQDVVVQQQPTSTFHGEEEELLQFDSSAFDVDAERFHTAVEFPSASTGAMEMEEVILMESVHEDPDDLQRALEEASSDESHQPLRTDDPGDDSSSRGGNANEMFPFRETSSDEDYGGGAAFRIRRRGAAAASVVGSRRFNDEEDEREETSGDDRKTTSESDVTTSPNPRAAAAAKNKKKKKKKK